MSNVDEAVLKFAEALRYLRDARAESISTVRGLQTASRIALQAEVSRLTDRYGADDVRTARMQARLQANSLSLRALELAAEKAAVGITIPAEDEAVIEGRVTDEMGRGLQSLVVALVDDKGSRVRAVEPVATAKAGYFGVRISGDVVKKLQKSHPDGIFVAVLDDKAKVIHVVDKAVALESGKVAKVDAVLRRSDFPFNIRTEPVKPGKERGAVGANSKKSKSN